MAGSNNSQHLQLIGSVCQRFWYQGPLLCKTCCFFPSDDASTHFAYPRRDGQTELSWVAGSNTKMVHPWTIIHLSTNKSPCPPIDSIIRLTTVWRITGKIIRTTIISPPENDSFWKDFCFGVVFFFFSLRNLRAPSADRREILHDAQCCVQFYNPCPKFLGSLPKKFLGAKTCKIWPDFSRLWSLAANISGTDEDIQNRWVTRSTAIPPALGETSPVKIGPVTLEV